MTDTKQANVPANVPEKNGEPESAGGSAIAKINENALARIILHGDITDLTPRERFNYYLALCERVGVDPLTRPFDFIEMPDEKDKERTRVIIYPNAKCTDQLRAKHSISTDGAPVVEEKHGCAFYTVKLKHGSGRTEYATGVVPLQKQDGEWKTIVVRGKERRVFEANGKLIDLSPLEKANAFMKAETKASRRGTLKMCGLGGMPDFDELKDAIPGQVRELDSEAVLEGRETRSIASPEVEQEKKVPAVNVDDFRKLAAVRDELALLVLGPEATGDQKQALGRERCQSAIGKPIPQTAEEIDQLIAAMRAEIESRGEGTGSSPAAPAPAEMGGPSAKAQKTLSL